MWKKIEISAIVAAARSRIMQNEAPLGRQYMATSLTIVKLAGVLDGAQAKELRQQVSASLASGHNFVMLDLADVNFIDSSGLGALIVALKMLRSAGGDLYLCSIAEPVSNLLKMTRMERLFDNQIPLSAIGNPKLPNVRG
jgi:anti-sigma B factor antagonist